MNEPVSPEAAVFTPDVLEDLQKFTRELIRRNRSFSLTKVHDAKVFRKLVAPSAWLGLEYGKEKIGVVADFGSGPGIPGLPMAIADRVNSYILIDSNGKKTAFARHCARVLLGLKERVEVRHVRVTKFTETEPVDRLVTRAAGGMAGIVGLWKERVAAGGVADFFKGTDAESEIRELVDTFPDARVEYLDVPEWFEDLRVIRVGGIFTGKVSRETKNAGL